MAEAAASAAAALAEDARQTERLAKLGLLVGAIAHELNNILTPVLSYCQLAKAAPHDAELVGKALDRATAGAERGAQIARIILGFARADDEPSDRADLVRCVRDLGASMPAGVRVVVEEASVCAAGIAPAAVQQVVMNLVANAARAVGESGEVRVRVGREGSWAVVDVEDNGPGVPPEVMARLFRPFASGERASGGTGLGLAISRWLVESAGGTIGVESSPTGTRFRVRLPVCA